MMGLVVSDDDWRMPDWLRERIEPVLPPPPSHPLGCHRPRVADRGTMDAILLVLRTGWRRDIDDQHQRHERLRADRQSERHRPTRRRHRQLQPRLG
jgi:hypothetical protein